MVNLLMEIEMVNSIGITTVDKGKKELFLMLVNELQQPHNGMKMGTSMLKVVIKKANSQVSLYGGMKMDRKKKKSILRKAIEMVLLIGGILMEIKKALLMFQGKWAKSPYFLPMAEQPNLWLLKIM